MHRKIVVVDREIAFVGGINIVDDRKSTGELPPRYDYAVAVEGPLVDIIRLSAQHLWSMVAWSSFRKGTVHDVGAACFNLYRGAHECGIPGEGQFPPSPGH